MSGQLPTTTRISDLIHALADPVEYINGMVCNFVVHGYDPETSVVRIGITGAGVAPNYRIEKPSYRHTLKIRNVTLEVTVHPAQIFNGRNRREMVELYDLEWRDGNWSAETITLDELKAWLSKLSQSPSIH
jgi:hypothetical protein